MVLFLTSFQFFSFGQTEQGFQQLNAGDFQEAILSFSKDLNHKDKKAAAEYGLAQIYLDTAYTEFNPDKAWLYYLACYESLKTIKPKKKQKYLQKHNIKLSKIKKQIPEAGLQVAKLANTPKAFEHFIEVFKKAPAKYRARATKSRNRAAFDIALATFTYKSFQNFIHTYEKSLKLRNPSILKQAHQKLFESYINENGWSKYEDFAMLHSSNPYILDSATESFKKIESSNDLEVHREFLDVHQDGLLREFSLTKVADLILKKGTTNDHNWFLFSYPDHKSTNDLWKNYLKLYVEENGKNSVIDFANEFPQYPFRNEMDAIKDKTIAAELGESIQHLKHSNDVNELLSFLETYPNNAHTIDVNKKLIPLLKENPSIHYYERYFTLNLSPEEMPNLLQRMYKIYAWDLNFGAINSFMENWGSVLPDTSFVESDRNLAKEKIKLRLKNHWNNENTNRYDAFIKKAAPNYAAYEAVQQLISLDIKNGNWSNASKKLDEYKSYFKQESVPFNQLQIAVNAEKQDVVRTKLPSAINTFGNEYAPVISVDGQTLFFCAKGRSDNLGREDIYFSKKINGNWTSAKLVNDINTIIHSEAPEAISADGNKMLIYKEGKLTFSNKTDDGWSTTSRLPTIINQQKWQADGSISSDGKAILFVSQRDELIGNPDRNNLDIYVALTDNNGKWNQVINLGPMVNTPKIDRSPYLHPDMKTLYFSSVGHGGFGGMDVFKTTRLDDTWTNWSTPINLGKEINTPESDWGYKVSTDGNTAFFNSSTDENNEDIFQIKLPEAMRPEQVSTLAGVLLDSNDKPIEADIVIEDLITGRKVMELKSDPNTGEFFAVLPDNKKYSYHVKKENFYPIANHIDLSTNSNLTIKKELKLYEVNELAAKGVSLTLENIFFDTDKFDLKSTSFQELDRLAALIISNNLKIDVSGHTDDVGSDTHNQTLSQNRANAVKDYFISKGIAKNNITAKGYGESKPISQNSTNEGKAKNRRVEIKFIKQ